MSLVPATRQELDGRRSLGPIASRHPASTGTPTYGARVVLVNVEIGRDFFIKIEELA